MKVELNVPERLVLMQIAPKENDFATLKVVRDFLNKVSFTEEELKEYGLVVQSEGTHSSTNWNSKGNEPKELEFGERMTDMIVASLKGLNEKKKLEQKHFTLYEKFVEKEKRE